MKKLFVLVFIAQAVCMQPCSIFSYKDDGKMFFCANEDWSAAEPAIMSIRPTGADYGVVLLGWNDYLPNYPQAGINSEGLCFDWASVPIQKYSENGKKPLDINSTIAILQKCKNIDEAIAYISNADFQHIAEEHLMLCDKNSSCVIEYTKGKLRVIKSTGLSQYITNFNLTDKEAGWYPCQRYAQLESKLNSKGLKENDLLRALKDTHQEAQYSTQYSYIIDVTDLSIKVFLKHDYDTSVSYRVTDLLRKSIKEKM